jgi:hypothetical protein
VGVVEDFSGQCHERHALLLANKSSPEVGMAKASPNRVNKRLTPSPRQLLRAWRNHNNTCRRM